jgi:CRISPR-associated protein Cas1
MKERYYIQSKGELYKNKDTLRFRNENKDTRIPIERVYDIFAEEGVSISSGVLELLSDEEVLLHSFGYYGNYIGTFHPKESVMSGKCVVEQAKHYNNKPKRLKIAREIVKGSIDNMRLTLMRYKDGCCDTSEYLKNEMSEVYRCSEISTLMQLEGDCREHYYNCLNHQLDGLNINKRNRQPPLDEVNALMSYLNSLIYAAIVSEIYKTRLDQKISFLHEPHERRFSLSLDVSDIFKPMIVDRLIISMVNQSVVDKSDFHQKGKGVFLDEEGRKKVVSEFKDRMSDTRKHQKTKKTHSIRRWLRMECHKIMKHIIDAEEYNYTTMR